MAIEIIYGLYIGNKKSAFDTNFLISRKISLIINTTNNVEFFNCCEKMGIKCIRASIQDNFQESERSKHNRNYFYQLRGLCEIIDNKLENNNNILIHCRHGKYQSTCLIIAYIMYKTKMKLDDVYELISLKYPMIKMKNHLFLEALQLFEDENRNLDK